MKDAHWKVLGIAGILLLAWAVLQDTQKEIQIGGVPLRVEVQDTDSLRIKGLSGRESLRENEGMLFIFEESGLYGFWMKDMNFSIDILWISDGKEIVEIAENVAPDTFPEIFYPKELAQYVLETQAGFVEKNDIQLKDKVLGL